MLVEATLGGERTAADGALEGPLPPVLPLVRHEPDLVLEHLAAEAALEPGGLVVVLDVRLEGPDVGEPLAAVLAVVPLVRAVDQIDVFSQMSLLLEDLMALLALVFPIFVLLLDVGRQVPLVHKTLVSHS